MHHYKNSVQQPLQMILFSYQHPIPHNYPIHPTSKINHQTSKNALWSAHITPRANFSHPAHYQAVKACRSGIISAWYC